MLHDVRPACRWAGVCAAAADAEHVCAAGAGGAGTCSGVHSQPHPKSSQQMQSFFFVFFTRLTGMQVGRGSAPPPQTLGTFAQQVLDALVPNEETILKLAGMAGNGATAGGTSRVPGEGSGGAHLSHSFFTSLRIWHFILSYHY